VTIVQHAQADESAKGGQRSLTGQFETFGALKSTSSNCQSIHYFSRSKAVTR